MPTPVAPATVTTLVAPATGTRPVAPATPGRATPRAARSRAGLPASSVCRSDLVLSPDEAVTEAQRLLDAGLPFPAHEVLEAAWKAAPDRERELWRGLAQLAVGLTHAQRGNARGAAALLERAGDRIGSWAAPAPAGVDIAGLRAYADGLAQRIEQDGLDGVTEADLRPHLRRLSRP